MLRNIVLGACLITVPVFEVVAHPVSFKGGFGVMPEYQPERQELELNYSVSNKAAIGVSSIHVQQKNRNATFVIPRFNYRLYRANEMDSQANVYLYGGVGGVESRDRTGAALLSGAQADYETRRVYTLIAGENIKGEEGLDVSRVRYRLGGAPYAGDFDDLHTWLIAQVEYTPDLENEWTVGPIVRLFYENYLIEVGSSTRGEVFAAGIFHF